MIDAQICEVGRWSCTTDDIITHAAIYQWSYTLNVHCQLHGWLQELLNITTNGCGKKNTSRTFMYSTDYNLNILFFTHPVLPFSNLEDTELLTTSTQHHQSLHFIMDLLCLSCWFPFLPVWPQSSNEFLPVNQTFSWPVKQVCYCIHF